MRSDMTTSDREEELARASAFGMSAAALLEDRHCEDVTLLEVRGLSQVCDFVLIGTGTSDRQMRSVAAELADLGAEAGYPAFRTNTDTGATWVVVDFINVVVHLFEPQRRAYYDLEDLWADARVVDVSRNSKK